MRKNKKGTNAVSSVPRPEIMNISGKANHKHSNRIGTLCLFLIIAGYVLMLFGHVRDNSKSFAVGIGISFSAAVVLTYKNLEEDE